jgi:parallel beta-helix repeat protein
MITSIAISSITTAKSPNSTAFNFAGGLAKSTIQQLLLFGQGDIPGAPQKATVVGSFINMGPVSDTVSVLDCVVWFCQGVAIQIGQGSEVRIEGGRLIGATVAGKKSGIGVYVTGNNGGVHVIGTDVIGHNEGVRVDNSNGFGSNREIFLNQATLDSNVVGLAVYDNSYVDVDGVWAASADHDQIWVSPQSKGAMLAMTGGTIFNGGAEGGGCSLTGAAACNGITVNAGSFSLTGVAIRNNKGRAIWVMGSDHYSITGCRVYGNGQGFKLVGGTAYLVANNVIFDNVEPNEFGSMAGGAIVKDNVGAQDGRG